ncbi:hypothetical protein EJ110_NYTH52831 [Nymphaea thermarum]|nr:hypothetical protein EJ110_NYTH52831 [Nymphaea thermarum]
MQDPSEGVFSSIAATLEPSDHHRIPPVSSDYQRSSTCTICAFQHSPPSDDLPAIPVSSDLHHRQTTVVL